MPKLGALRRLRRRPVRLAFDIVALAAVLALVVRLLLGPGASSASPDQWRIYPGPAPVAQHSATECFEASPAVSVVRSVGAADLVRFAGQRGFIRLQFLADEDAAIQAAYVDRIPWVVNNTIWSQLPSRYVLKRDTEALSGCLKMPPAE